MSGQQHRQRPIARLGVADGSASSQAQPGGGPGHVAKQAPGHPTGSVPASGMQTSAAATGAIAAASISHRLTGTPLVLIDGCSDTCAAFDKDGLDTVHPGANATSTLGYLTSHGFDRALVRKVGSYDNAWSWTSPNGTVIKYQELQSQAGMSGDDCDVNVRGFSAASGSGGQTCYSAWGQNSGGTIGDGYTKDPDMYLACTSAQYIYQTYTANHQPVNVLAHSMGGLLIRAALAFSGGPYQKAGFPTTPLLVGYVVTVATPHGGFTGGYAAAYKSQADSTEVDDMTTCPSLAMTCSYSAPTISSQTLKTSQFMTYLNAAGTPRGGADALWMLMASSTGACLSDCGGGITSRENARSSPSVPYPDTDFVVAGDSMVAMDADAKIYYGAADGVGITCYPNSQSYNHEANSCEHMWGPITYCSVDPYYLNDATTGTTGAWYCAGWMLYTNAHTGAADFTATWSPTLPNANGCYRVNAFVPDNWSNSAYAMYAVTDQKFGTSVVPVDENAWTNQYATLGVFQADASGHLNVLLTDQGPPSGAHQVAADAVRYLPVSRGSLYRTGLVIDAGTPGFSTVNTWYAQANHGVGGNERWTHTNGITPVSTATYTATLPTGRYSVAVFVPDYAVNAPSALYTIRDGAFTTATLGDVNQNAVTNDFVPLGVFETRSDNTIAVTVTDQDPTGLYVAADTVKFMPAGCSAVARAAVVVDPGTGSPDFTTAGPTYGNGDVNGWYHSNGGLRGNQYWTYANQTTTAQPTATYSPSGLSAAGGCYDVRAFVPDNHANNAQARYEANVVGPTSGYGTGFPIDQATPTNAWVDLGLCKVGAACT